MKKIIMILAVLGLMVAPSMAAIVNVASGSSSADITTTDATTQTLSGFAAGSGNYVVASVVVKSTGNTDNTPVTGVTYGDSTMTYIGMSHADESVYDVYTYLYGIASTVASGDIVASYQVNADGNYDGVNVVGTSWSGATGYTTVSPGSTRFASLTGDEFSDAITTTGTSSMIVSAFGLGADVTGVSSADSTIVLNGGSASSGFAMLSQAAATADDYASTYTWTGLNARRSSAISVELVPEPATVGLLGLGTLIAMLARRMRA